MVECNLPKVEVGGSNPLSRSIFSFMRYPEKLLPDPNHDRPNDSGAREAVPAEENRPRGTHNRFRPCRATARHGRGRIITEKQAPCREARGWKARHAGPERGRCDRHVNCTPGEAGMYFWVDRLNRRHDPGRLGFLPRSAVMDSTIERRGPLS